MDVKEPTHKAIFAAQIRAIKPTEREQHEIKASLSALHGLLPPGIDPSSDIDLVYVAGNLAVAGLVNLNDDGMGIDAALNVYKQFERRQCNIEHDRKRVCGYILTAGLTEFGTDRVITEDEARAAGKPFNIATVAVLWRVANKELCDYIIEASSPTHPDFKSLSLSFEVGFETYSIIALPKDEWEMSKAVLHIAPDDKEYTRYADKLRARGGDGFAPDDANMRVYRDIDQGAVPLGQGIVTVPAAAVKGITAISQPVASEPVAAEATDDLPCKEACEPEEVAADQAVEDAIFQARNTIDLLMHTFSKKTMSDIIFAQSSVSDLTSQPINESNMKFTDIPSLKAAASKAAKLEDYTEIVANVIDLVEVITQESERREAARKVLEGQAAELAQAKQEAALANDTLKTEVDALKSKLAALEAEQTAAIATAKFTERMAALDSIFDLTDDSETSAYFAKEVKACKTDEEFTALAEKSKKMFKEKTKDFKKKKADDEKDAKAALQAKLLEKGIKANVTDTGFEIEEIIASAQANGVSAPVSNTPAAGATDLKARAAAAFATDFTIGGKSASEKKK